MGDLSQKTLQKVFLQVQIHTAIAKKQLETDLQEMNANPPASVVEPVRFWPAPAPGIFFTGSDSGSSSYNK